ncbi:hypothetical protein U9M48_020689 [Paspalum notatum var. saurae]|uniref:Uncharacterized protein n=1 Tax=Paspalum notatum var. saurae TaxID=547442 RepID=A0AAQ3WSN8_PASNO
MCRPRLLSPRAKGKIRRGGRPCPVRGARLRSLEVEPCPVLKPEGCAGRRLGAGGDVGFTRVARSFPWSPVPPRASPPPPPAPIRRRPPPAPICSPPAAAALPPGHPLARTSAPPPRPLQELPSSPL